MRQWRRHRAKSVRHTPSRNHSVIFKAQSTTPEKSGKPIFRANTWISRQAGGARETSHHKTQQTRFKTKPTSNNQRLLRVPSRLGLPQPASNPHTPRRNTLRRPRYSPRAAYTGDRVSFTYPCSMGALLPPAETHHKSTAAMQSGCRKRACSVNGELGCLHSAELKLFAKGAASCAGRQTCHPDVDVAVPARKKSRTCCPLWCCRLGSCSSACRCWRPESLRTGESRTGRGWYLSRSEPRTFCDQ